MSRARWFLYADEQRAVLVQRSQVRETYWKPVLADQLTLVHYFDLASGDYLTADRAAMGWLHQIGYYATQEGTPGVWELQRVHWAKPGAIYQIPRSRKYPRGYTR